VPFLPPAKDAGAGAHVDAGGAAVVIASGEDGADAGSPNDPLPLPSGDAAVVVVSDPDAGLDPGPTDATPEGACPGPPGPGDLAIVELMVESVAGSGDHGEWIEIANARDCALDVRGLHGDCAAGAKVATFDIDDDVWLPPRGTLVVADSIDPAVEHDLPSPLVTWTGAPGDVLRNQGGTVTIRYGGAIVDSITYPRIKTPPGTSMAFPADCDAGARAEWDVWQPSVASWFPGFTGTPNAPNDDVKCRSP
jgi:hypothetical protein